MKRAVLSAAAMALCLACPSIFAQTFSGSLKSDLGSYFKSRDILPFSQDFPQQVEGKVEGKVGNPDAPDAQYSATLRVSFDPTTAATTVSLREAWLKAFLGPVDLSVGNQIVAWGSTDIFTPVDVVNALDLTLPLSPEKIPEFMGRAILNSQGFSVDLVFVPFWNGDTLPGPRWFGSGFPLPPGVSLSIVNSPPAPTWDNVQFGGRFQASLDWLQGVDVGLTYYRGFNTLPANAFSFGSVNSQTVTLLPTATPGQFIVVYDRYNLVGVDGDVALGSGLLFRTELGYKTFNDTNLFSPDAGSAAAEWVAAGEYTFLGIKTIGEFVLDWIKGTPDDTYLRTFVLIASTDLDSRSSLKALGGWNLDGSSFVSPQFSYSIADGLQAELKVYFFLGDTSTTFGQFNGNNYGEVSVKYAF
ncbi:MAG: DUF1302 family protein [Spirochaetia bacterium]|jgi:hypothetical protein